MTEPSRDSMRAADEFIRSLAPRNRFSDVYEDELRKIRDMESTEASGSIDETDKFLTNINLPSSATIMRYKLVINKSTDKDGMTYSFFLESPEKKQIYIGRVFGKRLQEEVSFRTKDDLYVDAGNLLDLIREKFSTIDKIEGSKPGTRVKVSGLEKIASTFFTFEGKELSLGLDDYDTFGYADVIVDDYAEIMSYREIKTAIIRDPSGWISSLGIDIVE